MKKIEKRGRGRPPKKPTERKDQDLRIPVTAAQKVVISKAVEKSGQDLAAWARSLLLAEAERMQAS